MCVENLEKIALKRAVFVFQEQDFLACLISAWNHRIHMICVFEIYPRTDSVLIKVTSRLNLLDWRHVCYKKRRKKKMRHAA